jgi:disintegrin and metalloproteinase domain-containing protein 10
MLPYNPLTPCLQVDPSGPLATLRKILLSDKSIASLKKFLTDHWYAAVIAVIAVIGLMVSDFLFCLYCIRV